MTQLTSHNIGIIFTKLFDSKIDDIVYEPQYWNNVYRTI